MPPALQVPRISGRIVSLAVGMAVGAGLVLAVTTLGRQPIRPPSAVLSYELSSGPLDDEFDGSFGQPSLRFRTSAS